MSKRRRARSAPQTQTAPNRRRIPPRFLLVLALVLGLGILIALALTARPGRLRAQAESAQAANDFTRALDAWRSYHRAAYGDAASWRSRARVCLALSRAAEADLCWERASILEPAHPLAWLARLERLRALELPIESEALARQALPRIEPGSRVLVLKALTLTLLADLPTDDQARDLLARWSTADPNDFAAEVALIRRQTALPRAEDPDVPTRLARLETLVARHPTDLAAREAWIEALDQAGEIERGRAALDGWPETVRDDPRYLRLRGGWDQDYDNRPEAAARAFRAALKAFPHDWRTWYRLARVERTLKHPELSDEAVRQVRRLREVLEPVALRHRLEADFAKLDAPESRADLADLAKAARLRGLAELWRAETHY